MLSFAPVRSVLVKETSVSFFHDNFIRFFFLYSNFVPFFIIFSTAKDDHFVQCASPVSNDWPITGVYKSGSTKQLFVKFDEFDTNIKVRFIKLFSQ